MRVAWILVLVGCYAPVPATGIPCAANGACPSPLVCDRSRAEPTCESSLSDAAPSDTTSDAPVDVPLPIDGAPLIDAGLTRCFDDDFEDVLDGNWTIVDPTWTIRPGEGPDGSAAFVASPGSSDHIVTHSSLRGVRSARLALDFKMDNGIDGDFNVYLVPPGWTDPNSSTQSRYSLALYVLGGDSGPDDRISRIQPPAATITLASRPISVTQDIWHHLDMTYAANGAITATIDGAPYLSSPPDSAIPGPLDLVIRFWSQGAIDNVTLDCTR